ncbi:MAG: DUF1007 family protein [Pseudomonadota bacterium]
MHKSASEGVHAPIFTSGSQGIENRPNVAYLHAMRRLALSVLCCLPLTVSAHPHVFIETGFELIFDDQSRLTHVRVTWAYDEFYSLLVLEELQLDADGDGELTGPEQVALSGFDANWIEGYNGDFEARLGENLLDLSGPKDPTATIEDGKIVSTHLRSFARPVSLAGESLSAKAYDETYYTAYDLTRPVSITGPVSCMIDRLDPDIDAQLAEMQALLLRLDADADLEENDIPLIGAEFATEIRVSCLAS